MQSVLRCMEQHDRMNLSDARDIMIEEAGPFKTALKQRSLEAGDSLAWCRPVSADHAPGAACIAAMGCAPSSRLLAGQAVDRCSMHSLPA